jgi:hypothetical protein
LAVNLSSLLSGLMRDRAVPIPWRVGENWSIYALPTISLGACLSSVYATALVKTKTPWKTTTDFKLTGFDLNRDWIHFFNCLMQEGAR